MALSVLVLMCVFTEGSQTHFLPAVTLGLASNCHDRVLFLMAPYNKKYKLCSHLEGWDREDGRERQEGGDMGMYVYV